LLAGVIKGWAQKWEEGRNKLSLQRRLTLFFVVIVILPLAAAGVLAQRIFTDESAARAELALGPAIDAPIATYNERSSALNQRAAATVGRRLGRVLDSRKRPDIDDFLERFVGRNEIDFLILVTKKGEPLGSAQAPGAFVPGFDHPEPEEIAAGGPVGDGFVSTEIGIEIGRKTSTKKLIAGFWLDDALLVGSETDTVGLSIVSAGQIIASTLELAGPREVSIPSDGPFETDLGGPVVAQSRPLADDVALLATTSTQANGLSTPVLTPFAWLLLLALIATGVLGFLLARLITSPLEELAAGAQAIAEGNFERTIPVRSRDEVGRLAGAFNEMSARLRATVGELRSSRNQLQLAIRRVGETLRSTHDMTRIRRSIVNTAADAIGADAAALWAFSPTRQELLPAETRGLEFDLPPRVKLGAGIVGRVADDAVTLVLPSEKTSIERVSTEPDFPVVIATPVYTQDRVTGVLANYRQEKPFTESDLETVKFLAEQGGSAIENVMLHEDTRRLSLTDGLTGVYNRRYLQMQARQTFATATRFGRQFSVLMVDLDRFKLVNDSHGHQRGDAVLVEFARRVDGTLREVDTFVRYGGEEFVCLLSETGLHGAMATAQKIIDVIRDQPFGTGDEEKVQLTVSAGVATFPDHGASFIAVLEAADRGLYLAKQEGRDRYRTAGQVAENRTHA
jgi:two-component system, cell cycle response regulator